jgi:predicted nuclease of predicted toxin-antitoxin system
MKFLIDNALSPVFAVKLRDAGHEAIHVRDIGMSMAKDVEILSHALKNDWVIVSADTDFSTLLALRQDTKPSFILFRWGTQFRAEVQASLLLANLPNISEALNQGSVIVFEEGRIRIRALPAQKKK